MATDIIDFAGLDSAAAAATTDTTTVDTTTEVDAGTGTDESKVETTETTEAGKEGSEKDKVEYNSDGSPKEKTEELPGDKNTPDGIRKLLKSMKDADPANSAAVKQLHGAFERFNAYTKVFPTVNDAKNAQDFIELVGGPEGYETLNSTVSAIKESDALLYSGDPKLIDNIIEDLKSEGKIDALGKLAPAFMEKLKAVDNDGYYKTFAPHFLDGLKEVNMPGAIGGIMEALSDPDLKSEDPAKAAAAATKALASITKTANGMDKWLKGLESAQAKTKTDTASPERQKLNEERAAFQKQQEEFKTNQTKEFQTSVATTCEKDNNRLLGSELKDYLRKPFFKGFTKDNLMPLGNTIKANLYETLTADKAYQAQMKAMWAAPKPDRTKIEEYHRSRVQSIAARIVGDTVQKMYPGYAKGGSAAARVAAATDKKNTQAKVEQKAAVSGKPIYVGQKPAREEIDKTKDPKDYLEISGKAYLKNGKFVTWRK